MVERPEQQVRELFEAALEREPDRRADFLSEACGQDAALLEEVRALLVAHEAAEGFLETPLLVSRGVVAPDPPDAQTGRRIGAYLTLRELGRGGMGVVYLAVRADDAYRRQVAIKLVWPGLAGASLVQRFYRERQILADLDHPHIARLYDGGTTEDG